MCRPTCTPGTRLTTCPRNRGDRSPVRGHAPDCMVLGIGDVDNPGARIDGQPLWPVELRHFRWAIPQPRFARADHVVQRATKCRQTHHHQAVMVAVGDGDVPPPPVVNQDAPGECKVGSDRGLRRWTDWAKVRNGRCKPSLVVKLGKHSVKNRHELSRFELAFVAADHLPARINEHQCRPGPAGELLPDGEIGIVDNRMPDSVATHRLCDGLVRLLLREFRRMDANHDHPVGVPFLNLPQLRKYV